jgi:hypothetical protein
MVYCQRNMLGKQHLDGLPIAAGEAGRSRYASFHVRVMNGALARGQLEWPEFSRSGARRATGGVCDAGEQL